MFKRGLTMQRPLLLSGIIEHAAAQFGSTEIVSREADGTLWRYDYGRCTARARQLANALCRLGLAPGDAVATIAWNNHRHLEAYYAVSGSGMLMHTCNPRLPLAQLAYIINHAEDKAVMFDLSFAPLVKALAPSCPGVRHWILLGGSLPEEGMDGVFSYEALLKDESESYSWPAFDENTGAALCYTSGTTGNPKGVLYSHRAIVLNAMAECLPSALSLSPREVVLPVVPMFHINAWCIPYAAPIAGCKLVLPGAMLDGASLHGLMEGERVTTSAGVPTIWQSLVAHMQAHGLKLSTLRRTAVGGSALPRALIATLSEDYGIDVRQAWGMTETTGLATMSCLDLAQPGLSADERHAFIARQGRSVFGVECKVVDEQGNTLPRDGASQGELLVRGPWITASYFKSETPILVEGWFPTGDVATIAADGTVQIRDRTKDLIKSGGEWINSIELEAAAMDHPGVAMCAVIAVPSGRWGERPLMFIVPKPGVVADRDALMATLSARVIKSWLPDEIVFLDNLPVGGTGKVQKAELRRRYGGVYG